MSNNHGYNMEKYRKQFPKKLLEELLTDCTYRDLQEKTGINEHIFSILAKEYGIPKNTRLIGRKRNKEKLIKFDYDDVYDMYINQHKSSIFIAKKYNCSKRTVLSYLDYMGIPKRDAHDPLCYKSRILPYSKEGIDSNGYVVISVNGEKMREHRYVMEQYLGRCLKSNEHVHHMDFNKTNNDINNLFVFPSNTLHQFYHAYLRVNPYLEPQYYLEKYKDGIEQFLSFENMFDLYVRKNYSIKHITEIFDKKFQLSDKISREPIKWRLFDLGLFDANNLDINQYIKKDTKKLLKRYEELKQKNINNNIK